MSFSTQFPQFNYTRGLTAFGRLLERAETTDEIISALAAGVETAQFTEKDGVYRTEIVLAGYKREEISIEATADGYVTVTAENKTRGKTSRAFYLSDLDADRIEAKLEDGVLTLELPRVAEALPRKVVVK